jgi:NTP pyrophosphatase (non-canonical NTP hydrolase)
MKAHARFHFNNLTEAELERLAILGEELSEAGQIIGKILRHGYSSHNPNDPEAVQNRELLTKELGDVLAAINLLTNSGDIDKHATSEAHISKLERLRLWVHHQPSSVFL